MATIKGGLLLIQETPSGIIDGANVVFSVTTPYVPGSLMVFVNGLLQAPIDDYTESLPSSFIMVIAPKNIGSSADKLRVAYQIK